MKWPIVWVWDTSLSALLLALIFLSTLKLVESSSRKRWIVYGLLWGVAALTNPALLSTLPFSLLWFAMRRRRANQSWLIPAIIVLTTFIVCTAPWMIRNAVVLGKPVFIRDNFWFEFHLGNYHLSNAMGWGGKHPTLNHIQLDLYRSLGEVKYIEHFRGESLEFVRDSPREFAQLTLRRFTAFWNGGFFAYTCGDWWELPAYVACLLAQCFGAAACNRESHHGCISLCECPVVLSASFITYISWWKISVSDRAGDARVIGLLSM